MVNIGEIFFPLERSSLRSRLLIGIQGCLWITSLHSAAPSARRAASGRSRSRRSWSSPTIFMRYSPCRRLTPTARASNGDLALWQRRFWEHTIRDENDFERHVDYIHFNPIKHGLVERVRDWPHSSFHRYVKEG